MNLLVRLNLGDRNACPVADRPAVTVVDAASVTCAGVSRVGIGLHVAWSAMAEDPMRAVWAFELAAFVLAQRDVDGRDRILEVS